MTSQQPEHGALGTLWLVAKKTGMDMQSFPIDAERVTIGRDYDSDIRLYFSDVSKLHCEIKFDESNGQAHLHVHGSHGIKYAAHCAEMSTYKPPAVIALSNNDTFIVRKKLFRFEYGHEEIQVETPPSNTIPLPSDSPVKAPASPTPILGPRRKRVSYRMSLVPSGKPFEPLASPMKSRRHSIIGLDAGPQVVRTPKKKSGLANQIREEEEQHEEEDEVIIEAINGEEGDVLYFEEREEVSEQKAIHHNPFMTPQQKRKAPVRNTSVVPRTRKQLPPQGAENTSAQHADTAQASTDSPKTPRSVPLPQGGETPYSSQNATPVRTETTPRSVPLPPVSNTPYHVSAQVAMSTPRGPLTLHKALLLRSARKAWQSSQAQGIEGAIQNGSVSVKRKSLSPQTRDSRKGLTPAPVDDAEEEEEDQLQDESESDEEEYEDATPTRKGELQWVYEDGHASASVDESDSSIDSLEADQSLDIPGQGVISFSPQPTQSDVLPEQEQEQECSIEYDDEEAGEEQYDEEEAGEEEESYGDENPIVMEAQDVDELQDEAEEYESENIGEEEVESTPVVQRSLDRFYTPQPQRSMVANAPRTLSSIGGPAVRFQRMPETPLAGIRRVPPTPGSLGAPSRRITQPVFQETEEDEESVGPSTPVKREVDPAVLEEAKRRRETLGTPRNLPAPPRSFKTPVREFSLRNPNKAAPHPALAIHSPEHESGDEEAGPSAPLDPIESVQRRLDSLRRQSMKRQSIDAGRRATVGFTLPSTPARSHAKPSAAYTVLGNRTATAVVYEQDEEQSLPPTPTAAAQNLEDDISVLEGHVDSPHAGPSAPSAQAQRTDSREPATPQFGGMKEMFRTVLPPNTPSFAGLRSMFASDPSASAPTPRFGGMKEMFQEPRETSTPQMAGLKTMFREPKATSTPRMAGIKEMYQLPQNPATPAMDGLKEMYEMEEVEQEAALKAEPETSSEEEEMFEGDSEIIVVAPPPSVPKASSSSSTVTAPPPIKAPRSNASKLPTASAPARKAATSTTQPKAKPAPATSTTARKATASTSTRNKQAASEAAPKKSAPATKRSAPAAMLSKPRPGDIDYFSESEIDESIEYDAPAPVPKKAEPVKPTRSTATRVKKEKPEAGSKEAPTKSTRGKKAVLGENGDQAEASTSSSFPVPAPAKATRARKAPASVAAAASTEATTATTTKTTAKSASTTTSKSAPARRTKTVTAEKENAPEEPVVKKAPAKRAVKKAEPKVAAEPVVTTRATRSRK